MSNVNKNINFINPCQDEFILNRKGFKKCFAGETIIKTYNQAVLINSIYTKKFSGSVFSYSNPFESIRKVDEPPIKDYLESYLGYDMSTVKNMLFLSAPRYANYIGRVFVYSISQNQITNYLSKIDPPTKQLGQYFGGSLLALDINNNNTIDLIVGLPRFSHIIDEGLVYIYKTNSSNVYTVVGQLNGRNQPRSMFGSDIINIGDINKDGRNDIAILAPFEDKNGRIYIYISTDGSFVNIPSQIIQPVENVYFPYTSTNFIGEYDVDKNNYPDILIGDSKNNMVFLYRTRPIINIKTQLYPSKTIVKLSSIITKVLFNFCLNYSYSLNSVSNIDEPGIFDGFIEVDANGRNIRALSTSQSFSIDLSTNTQCIALEIQVKGDFITSYEPIEVAVDGKVRIKQTCANNLCPIVNYTNTYLTKAEIWYEYQCNKGICKPMITFFFNDTISIPQYDDHLLIAGREKAYVLYLSLKNDGDPAIGLTLKITSHKSIEIFDVKLTTGYFIGKKSVDYEPNMNIVTSEYLLVNNIKEGLIAVYFSVPTLILSTDSFIINLEVNWLELQNIKSVNLIHSIPVIAIADFHISALYPEYLSLNNLVTKHGYIDNDAIVVFTITNIGYSDISNVQITIQIPTHLATNYFNRITNISMPFNDSQSCSILDYSKVVSANHNSIAKLQRNITDCLLDTCVDISCILPTIESRKTQNIVIRSSILSNVTSLLPFDLKIKYNIKIKIPNFYEIKNSSQLMKTISIIYNRPFHTAKIPIWIIVVSIIVALLLLFPLFFFVIRNEIRKRKLGYNMAPLIDPYNQSNKSKATDL